MSDIENIRETNILKMPLKAKNNYIKKRSELHDAEAEVKRREEQIDAILDRLRISIFGRDRSGKSFEKVRKVGHGGRPKAISE